MTERQTIHSILLHMDRTIDWYQKRNDIVEKECGYRDGKLMDARRYAEYEGRRRDVRENYKAETKRLYRELKEECARFQRQNADVETYLQKPPLYVRRFLTLGRMRVSYKELDQMLPLALRMPLSRALCMPTEQQNMLRQIMFRLLFSLPPGLCRFHVYDPNHFGDSIGRFDCLRDVEEVFPDGKIFCNAKELQEFLEQMAKEFAEMRQNRFPIQNCRSWAEYNRTMYAKKLPRKQLPYHVLICFELPESCGRDVLEAMRRLAREGGKFGFLLIFSYQAEALIKHERQPDGTIEQYQNEHTRAALCSLVEETASLDGGLTDQLGLSELHWIHVEEHLADPMEEHRMERYLREYRSLLEQKRGQIISFAELIRSDAQFSKNAVHGLEIPLGQRADNGEILCLPVGDQPPHTLIAGNPGSGKSNLLHILILSACWHYSPDELNVYLLDFKDGVEFAAYTRPVLPHARLVATQADPDYGLTVLAHLVDEIKRRNELFKARSVKDYAACRGGSPQERLPRLLLIVDEFQRIFDSDPNCAVKYLEILTKQGRSAGIHLIFATQTLKGICGNSTLSFPKNQFEGRIALKSSPADAKEIFFGQNNEDAMELTIPYAILNTSNGMVSGNQKFAVPEAKAEYITQTLQELVRISGKSVADTRIFQGQELPEFPAKEDFFCDHLRFLLGQHLDYAAEHFILPLADELEQNLLICGSPAYSMLQSVCLSAESSRAVDELVYIGAQPPKGWQHYADPQEFFGSVKEIQFSKKRLILLDGCVFPKMPFTPKPEDQEFFTFWKALSEHGSHIVGYYKTFQALKDSQLPYKQLFTHRISYRLSPSQMQEFGAGTLRSGTNLTDEYKAVYFYQEQPMFFRPFREREEGTDV